MGVGDGRGVEEVARRTVGRCMLGEGVDDSLGGDDERGGGDEDGSGSSGGGEPKGVIDVGAADVCDSEGEDDGANSSRGIGDPEREEPWGVSDQKNGFDGVE